MTKKAAGSPISSQIDKQIDGWDYITVKELRKNLLQFNQKAKIHFYTNSRGPLLLLSIYTGDGKTDDKTKELYIDIGEADE